MKKTFLILMVFIICGCAGSPFKAVRLSSVEHLEPAAVLDSFEKRLPDEFQITESVVFEYRRKKMTAIGYSKMKPADDFIAAAGFTPAGIKIFELQQMNGRLDYEFSLPPEIEKKIDKDKTARVMAEDMWRIYFKRVPGKNAGSRKSRDRIYFSETLSGGTVEFVFGGPDRVLVEKKFIDHGKEAWRVRYYEYREKNGKIYPAAIFYENHQGRYKVTLRLKEINA